MPAVDVPSLTPPAIYRNVQPAVPVVDEVVSFAEADRRCRELMAARDPKSVVGMYFHGCALSYRDKCWIIRIDVERVRLHELAHCAGWPPDHPGGVWEGPPLSAYAWPRER
jgi:hypothetical protein